ncbi:hypothetical protein BGZ80_004877, partial [Entomortierella chlamydospora]
MSQVKTQQRISLQALGAPRSPTTFVASPGRPRRININLPQHSATSAAFTSSSTGSSTLTQEAVHEERTRYTMLVAKNATSE